MLLLLLLAHVGVKAGVTILSRHRIATCSTRSVDLLMQLPLRGMRSYPVQESLLSLLIALAYLNDQQIPVTGSPDGFPVK